MWLRQPLSTTNETEEGQRIREPQNRAWKERAGLFKIIKFKFRFSK